MAQRRAGPSRIGPRASSSNKWRAAWTGPQVQAWGVEIGLPPPTAVPDRRLEALEPASPTGSDKFCDRGGVLRVDELGCPPDSSDQAEVSVGAGLGLAEDMGHSIMHHKDRGSTSFMSKVKCIFITNYCHYTFARSQRPTEYFQSVGGKPPFEMGQKKVNMR